MKKDIRRMCGIHESSRRRGLADFSLEVFYIHFIEEGSSRKAPELKNNCLGLGYLSVKVIERQVMFQEGSVRPVNIVFKQKSPSVPETEASQSCTSSGKQLPQENIANKSTDKQENLPKRI